jgi:LmbE family N-acetylglucosaminyl deacetylase
VEDRVRARWRAHTLTCGRDVTERSTVASCLVLAPHPDDETIGCGATIARKTRAGTPVRVLVAADGRSSHRSTVVSCDELVALRGSEVSLACRELGVAAEDLVRLSLPDGSLAHRQDELSEAIGAELAEHEPDEVLVPSASDWHPDHRALHSALLLALRRHRRPARVLAYPVWFWIHGPWDADRAGPRAPRAPTILYQPLQRSRWARADLVDTTGFLGVKMRALAAHRTQVENLTGEATWATLGPDFVASFLLPWEVQFPLRGP